MTDKEQQEPTAPAEPVELTPEEEIAVAAAPAEDSLSVDELLKRLDMAKREVQELKAKVAAANKKKEAAFRKKQEVSREIGEKIGVLVGSKKERNALTGEVRELKKERDRLNKEIREKVGEIKKMNEEHKDILGKFDRKSNPAYLQRQIEQLEYKLETQPMGFEAEQRLTKKIKDLKKQYAGVKDKAGALVEIRERSKEIDRLKKEANRLHRQVQEHAQASQERHEELLGESQEVDELKKREEECYKAFLAEKERYTEINNQLKGKLAELQTVKDSLNKQNVKLKEDQKQEEIKTLKERAKEAEQKVKKKGKLTTEDLLALQGVRK